MDLRRHLDFVKLASEPFNFLLVLKEQGILGVLVDDWGICNVFSLRSILQGGKSLLEVGNYWGNGRNHNSFGISSKAVLQKSGQFGVSIWNECSFALY